MLSGSTLQVINIKLKNRKIYKEVKLEVFKKKKMHQKMMHFYPDVTDL